MPTVVTVVISGCDGVSMPAVVTAVVSGSFVVSMPAEVKAVSDPTVVGGGGGTNTANAYWKEKRHTFNKDGTRTLSYSPVRHA